MIRAECLVLARTLHSFNMGAHSEWVSRRCNGPRSRSFSAGSVRTRPLRRTRGPAACPGCASRRPPASGDPLGHFRRKRPNFPIYTIIPQDASRAKSTLAGAGPAARARAAPPARARPGAPAGSARRCAKGADLLSAPERRVRAGQCRSYVLRVRGPEVRRQGWG